MAYDAKALEIFIASPSDVSAERMAVREAIVGWNSVFSRHQKVVLMPSGWETLSPELAGRPQGMINERALAHADIVIGIFWSRVGTATGQSVSGTIEEIERHHAAGKPTMLYFSEQPIPQDMIDSDQLDKLKVFKAWASKEGIYRSYKTPDELGSRLRDHLPQTMRDNRYLFGVLGGEPAASRDQTLGIQFPTATPVNGIVDPDALRILKNGAEDGYVYVLRHLGGTDVQAGKVNFTTDANARVIARWTEAVNQLVGRGLIRDPSGAGQVFAVTDAGFKAADALPDEFLGKG